MMKRLKYLALAAMFAFAACDEEGPGPVDPGVQTGTVTGSVTAEGAGVAGVTVTLAGATSQSATTGADGAFSFSSVAVGNYAVTISGVPADFVCSSTSQTVTVASGQTSTVSFTCNIVRTASISGTVTAGTNAIAGATLTVTRAGGTPSSKTTGANGQFQFTGLRSGDYTVTLTPPAGVTCATTTQSVNLVTGEAEIVNFSCEGAAEAPEITIERITVGGAGTTVPADPDSLAGRVEVTVNIDPRGNDLEQFQLLAVAADGTVFEICRQTFTSGVEGPQQQGGDELSITCSWNTDRTRDGSGASTIRSSTAIDGTYAPIAANANRPFNPVFLNGDYELVARVTTVDGQDERATVDVTLRNMDAIILGVDADNTNWTDPTTGQPFPNFIIDPTTGLRWVSGDIEVTAYPVIFSAPFDPNNPALQRAAFMFSGFRAGASVTVGGTELTAPNANGTFTFTFCEAATGTATDGGACYARIHAFNTGVIGARSISLVTKTAFGQFGPTLANLKSLFLFDQDLQSGARGVLNDVLRIDNEGPVAGVLGLTAHPVPGFSRWGGTAGSLGWVNHPYVFASGYADPASDNPFTYPAVGPGPDQTFGTADDGPWCDPAGDICVAGGATLVGIGLPAGTGGTGGTRPQQIFHTGPDAAAGLAAGSIAPALGSITRLVVTGADLTPETDSPGLSALPAPNSDTEIDYALTARSWDRFGNTTLSNVIYIGVDGQAPIFGTGTPTNPTAAGSVYNTYGSVDNRGAAKTAGTYTGNTTDSGQGFSGVAGIEIADWENACASGVVSCAGTPRNFRGAASSGLMVDGPRGDAAVATLTGKKAQPIAPGGATTVLAWTYAAVTPPNDICGILCPAFGDDIHELAAFDASLIIAAANDGYRQQMTATWDRAGNPRMSADVTEHIADKVTPVVGNVEMPTTTLFNLGQTYTFGGFATDNADLFKSDFDFDFNSITTLQGYVDPAGGTGNPVSDADGRAYLATSLQLPLENEPHTAFGSAAIMLAADLEASPAFLGCLVRFDEAGLATVASHPGAPEPAVHRPRGPRWRTWDHSGPYGLVNTQFNTFVPTSVPPCGHPDPLGNPQGPTYAQITGGFTPSPGTAGAWSFAVVSSKPTLTLRGPTASFVPNVDPSQIWLYHLDGMGRAILLDTGSANWTLVVSDTGTGALGRSYAFTYNGTLPAGTNLTDTAGTAGGYFFVVRRSGSLAGTGIIWDETSNP